MVFLCDYVDSYLKTAKNKTVNGIVKEICINDKSEIRIQNKKTGELLKFVTKDDLERIVKIHIEVNYGV